MKNNKDLISSSRREKVVFNITRLIKERNITQRQLSEKLGYDESLVSKWKQGTSTPSLDMIDAIAKFFDVHPHDIYYLEEEKEKIAIKSSGTYQAEQVKENVVVKNYSDYFSWQVLLIIFAITIIFLLDFYLLKFDSMLGVIFCLIGLAVSSIALLTLLIDKHRFIINYLDKIYHTIDNNKFKLYGLNLSLNISSIFILIALNVLSILVYGFENSILICLVSFIFILAIIATILNTKKNLAKKVFDNCIEGSKSNMFLFVSAILLFAATMFSKILGYTGFDIVVLSFVILILIFVSTMLYASKIKEYYLVIENENDEINKLKI